VNLSIGSKLVLSFLAVALAVSAAGLLALVVLEKASLDSIGDNLDDQAALAMGTIGRDISDRLDELHLYAQAVSLFDEAARSNREFAEMPDREERIESTERDWVAGRQTPLIQSVLESELSRELGRYHGLLVEQHKFPLLAEMFVANKYGVVIGATGRTSDYFQADEPWYRAAVEDGHSVGDVKYDASSDSFALDLAVALTDGDGQTQGVLKGVLNIEDVRRLVERLKTRSRYRSTRAYLVDRDGRSILGSPTWLPKQEARDVEIAEFGEDLSATEAVAAARKTVTGHALISNGGETALAVYSRLQSLPGHPEIGRLGWTLIVEYDADEVLQHVLTAQRFLLIASLAVTAAAILGGILFSRSLSRRIRKITATAAEMSSAKTAAKIEETGSQDEIGVLTRTFNRMTETLFAAHAQLADQNRELEQFTYTVSHDLKSPLITIKNFLGMLAQDVADGNVSRANDDMLRIGNAADRMDELLRDLLDLSRVGRRMNQPEEVALAELVEEVLELLGGSLRERRVQLDVSPALPAVFCDRLRLRQVLQNLVENAVKHMGDRPDARIEIDARRVDNDVLCRVRDNGIGIDPRYREKIFGLFEKLDQQTDGTGIGLALARRIVEIHGGRIWVESEGGGARGGLLLHFAPEKRSEPNRGG
jgi:signal transduction histidine kinase